MAFVAPALIWAAANAGTIATVATVAGGAMTAVGQIQAGNAQYKASMFNAQIARQNADLERQKRGIITEQYARENQRLGEKSGQAIGAARAAAAANGIDPDYGSALDIQNDTRDAASIDRDILGRNYGVALRDNDMTAYNYLSQATLDSRQAKSAITSSRIGAAGTLLTTAGAVAKMNVKPPTSVGDVDLAPASGAINLHPLDHPEVVKAKQRLFKTF